MSEAPHIRDGVRPTHPLIDIMPLFTELDTYLLARGKEVLTKEQRASEYSQLQKIANDHFKELSESDNITDFVIAGEVAHTGLDQGAEPVVQQVLQVCATAAKMKAWQELASKYLPES